MTWTRAEADRQRELLLTTLQKHAGNVTAAAAELNVTRQTYYARAEKLGLHGALGLAPPGENGGRPAPAQAAPSAPELRLAVTVKLPESLWKWARITAINRGTTASALVQAALERLRDEPAPGNPTVAPRRHPIKP